MDDETRDNAPAAAPANAQEQAAQEEPRRVAERIEEMPPDEGAAILGGLTAELSADVTEYHVCECHART